jgi:hypothetical protein
VGENAQRSVSLSTRTAVCINVLQHRHRRNAVNRFLDVEAEVDTEEEEEEEEDEAGGGVIHFVSSFISNTHTSISSS